MRLWGNVVSKSQRHGNHILLRGIIIASLTLSLLAFQNCGELTQGSLFPEFTSKTFPYEIVVDQVAYMSCAEQENVNNDYGVYFTFRAGAYGDNTGLGLTQAYLDEVQDQDNSSVMDDLALNGLSRNSRLQLGIRNRDNLLQLYQKADSVLEEEDFDYIFGTLGSDEMSASLLTLPEGEDRMGFWAAGGINNDARFQGVLTFNESELMAEQIRDYLSDQGYLTFTFADEFDEASIRHAGSSSSEVQEFLPNAFGRGLNVEFSRPNPGLWAVAGAGAIAQEMPARVLHSISEVDLMDTRSNIGNWECRNSMQFMIAFPEDAAPEGSAVVPPSNCYMKADPASPTDEFLFVRRSLPASDWWIDMANRCVIPKKHTTGSCYGIDSSTRDTRNIQYDFTQACDPAIADPHVCPHFVSICFKTN